jgi:phytanoyl-CoA hydroxylase
MSDHNAMYADDGLLHVPRLLDAASLHAVELALQRYAELLPTLPAADIVRESDGRAIRNLWRMEQHSAFFQELAESPQLKRLVAPLVNGEPICMGVELFAKPARVGSAVPLHQDNGYFNLTPPDALTCWIALDASTRENGCVLYARGSHRQGLLPHKATGIPGNSWGLADPPAPATLDEVPGLLHPGDAMLHHCCLLHRSEPNGSDRARRGLLIVYKAAHCRIDPEGLRLYQAAARSVQ